MISYFVSFINDASRFAWVFPIKRKSDIFSTFVKFKALVEKQYNKKIKIIRSDNGGEFTSHEFEFFFESTGHYSSEKCFQNPQQNGVAERFNRTIIEAVRSMISDAKLSIKNFGLKHSLLLSTLEIDVPRLFSTTKLRMKS